MGYAVLHLEKAKGSDSAMSAHIERTVEPKNADSKRKHLNRELVQFPSGVANRTQAIQHRLDTANLKRKIGKNQVRAIRVMLTGTHEDMAEIERKGGLDSWCRDNLDWLRAQYGAENLVSAVLHLDEKTPHIHATVVPIVATERVRRKREEGVKRNYKSKSTPRLCADEVMSRAKLKAYQDSYAEAMGKYGLQRGVDGSKAKHTSTAEYYRELTIQTEVLKSELQATKSEVSKAKLKSSAADVGSKLLDGASSLLGTSKVKRLEQENEALRSHIEELKSDNAENIATLKQEFNERETELSNEVAGLKSTLTSVMELIPEMMSHLRFTKLCKTMGFGIEMIRQLINGEEVRFSGSLYSAGLKSRYHTDGSVAKRITTDNGSEASLLIDNKPHTQWFADKHRHRLNPQQSNQTKSKIRR